MKALIWKEARQQLVWFLVAISLATQLWFGMGNVWDQLVRPLNETALWSLAYPLLYALALAQLQFGRDGDTRHFGLLVHRERGARGYFASKVIVGAAALLCVTLVPVTIWTVVQSLYDPDAALIRWVRIPQACLPCVPALIAYSMSVLSTQLRRGALVRWGVAIGGVFGGFLLGFPLALILGPMRMWIAGWIGLDLLVAGAVLWLARALLLQGRDRDLPLRDSSLAGVATIAFLILLPFGWFLLGTAESSALSAIVENKPAVLFDQQSENLVVAVETEEGWRPLDPPEHASGTKKLTRAWSDQFTDERNQTLDLVHYAGSMRVEGPEEARGYLEAVSKCRTLSDQAARYEFGGFTRLASARAADEPEFLLGLLWAVHIELDAGDGRIRIDVSRRADRLPPLRLTLARPDGTFSPEAGFLGPDAHAPLVLDRADGTLWKVQLKADGARLVRLELPQGDRVSALEPLFRRDPATLGRFEQKYPDTAERSAGIVFVGRAGKYVLLGDQLVHFDAASRPKNSVTEEEARALARFAVASDWPDAFTEAIRVERLPDHQTVLELDAEPSTRGARTAATIYRGLSFLRAPAGVLAECLWGFNSSTGRSGAPFAHERKLFASGRHPLLFALLMLSGALQLTLGWRWLARGGAGVPARLVFMLLILVGGVAALVFTRLLLPRHPRPRPAPARLRAAATLPARA